MPVNRPGALDNVGDTVLLPHEKSILDDPNSLHLRFINPAVQVTSKGPKGDNVTRTARGGSEDTIKFQFPPKVTSDTKSINWREEDVKSYEPLAFFMGSKARNISLKWEYVVYGNWWDAYDIFDQVRKVKKHAYWGNIGSGGGTSYAGSASVKAPIVKLVAYMVVPHGDTGAMASGTKNPVIDESSWRLININVRYSDEMAVFSPPGVGSGFGTNLNAWPVHTEISLDLRMLTANQVVHLTEDSSDSDQEGVLNRYGSGIAPSPQDIWY